VKSLRKTLEDLAEEGVLQLLKPLRGSHWIIGVIGQLQLEVIIARIESEYNIKAILEPTSYDTARWLTSEDPAKLKEILQAERFQMAEDRDGRLVYLVRDIWDLRGTQDRWKMIQFNKTCEQYVVEEIRG